MKKLVDSIAVLLMIAAPSLVFAGTETIFNTNRATVSVRQDQVDFKAFVCKLQSCDYQNEADWYNFNSFPVIEGQSEGDGKTLLVKPGDTLTFLGEVSTNSVEGINPQFKAEFVGAEYLDTISFFETGQDDLDGDGILYQGDTDNMHFSESITNKETQYGSITAKVKDNVPDNTVITANFIYDDSRFTKNPFINYAFAEDQDRSGVKIIVSNPPVQTAQTTQVLPKTGGTKTKMDYIIPAVLLTAFLTIVGSQLVSRKRQQVK